MRKNLKKIITCALLSVVLTITFNDNVQAVPKEIYGSKPLIVWDYFQQNYDKDGNVRVTPEAVTFSTTKKTVEQPVRVPVLKSEDTKLGHNLAITFEDNSESRQWVNNIYRITKLDSLTGNPNLQEDVSFEIENGRVTLYGDSRAMNYNDIHTIRIYSTGYDYVDHQIHVVKDAPLIKVHPDFRPFVGGDILFQLENFNYAVLNPIYEVELDGVVLKGDCEQYHVVSNLIRLENEGKISTPGKHTLKVKARGFEDAELEFVVVEGSEVANPVFDHDMELNSFITSLNGGEEGTSSLGVDITTSASIGGGDSEGSAGGSSGGRIIRANLIFDFELISNAYILKELGMETTESERVRYIYETATKDAAVMDGNNRVIKWSGFTNAVLNKQVEGSHITFEEYANSPEAEDYVNKPYYRKYVLQDGVYGEQFLASETMLDNAPEITIEENVFLGNKVKLKSENTQWLNNIIYVKVGTTVLRSSEYSVNNDYIEIDNNRLVTGVNTVEIASDGFKTKRVDINVQRESVTLALKEEAKVKGAFEVIGINEEYGKRISSISLNGKNLFGNESVGADGHYRVYSDKIVFSSNVLEDETNKVLIIKAYGYEDKVITFKPLPANKPMNPEDNVVPVMEVVKTELGNPVIIQFNKDNPLWREKLKGINVGMFTINTTKYTIDENGIIINGGVFNKGDNIITIQSEGYTDKVMTVNLLQAHPALQVKQASLKDGVIIDATEWVYVDDITEILVNGSKIEKDKYAGAISKINIDKSVFVTIGTYEVTIKARDYKDGVFSINVTEENVVVEDKNAPEINTFSDFKVGEDVKIDFLVGIKDFSDWFHNFVVKVDGNVVDNSKIVENSDSVTLSKDLFTEGKDYELIFESTGYKSLTKSITVIKEALKQPINISETFIYNGQSLELPLGDWSNNITEIKVKLEWLPERALVKNADYYEGISNGVMIIKGDVFSQDGWIDITIKSQGYRELTHRMMIKPKLDVPSEIAIAGDSTINVDSEVTINLPSSYGGENDYKVHTVMINDVKVPDHLVSFGASKIVLSGDNFKEAGQYNITLLAEKFKDKKFTITTKVNSTPSDKLKAPSVISDTDKNTEGNDIELTFSDNEAWRNNIKRILLNGSEVNSSRYSKLPGILKLYSSAFSGSGTYNVVIESEGYENVELVQEVGERVPDLNTDIQNKTVDRETLTFYAKWYKQGEFIASAASVTLNGVEVEVKSGASYDFEVQLIEGDNIIELSIPQYNVKESFTVTYEKPEIKAAPIFENKTTKVGESVRLDLEDVEWINNIEKVTINGQDARIYSDYSKNAHSKNIEFYSSVFNEIKDYNICVKSFGYEDLNITVTTTKKNVPSSVAVITTNPIVGENVKIALKRGFMDSSEYKDSITKVIVNGVEISDYSIVTGESFGDYDLVIDGVIFDTAEGYTITIESSKFKSKVMNIIVIETNSNTTGSAIKL